MSNILRRIICNILVFSVCIGIYCLPVYSEDNIQIVSDEMNGKMEVLRLLGIISDYYDYNTDLEQVVSRADFADNVARLIKYNDYKGSGIYYYDVPQTHHAYNSICALSEMGIINGVGEKRFEPDAPITVAAAYKIILSVMGYDIRAEYDGGYPDGYMRVAKKLNLYMGGNINDDLKRGQMFEIMYAAMTTDVLLPVAFDTENNTEYKVVENQTILSLYHDVHYVKAIVTGAEQTSIDGKAFDNGTQVMLDGVLCESKVALREELGEEVEAFVHYDKATETRTVLWAERTGRTDTLNIEYGQSAGFDKNSFVLSYYDSGDRLHKINLNRKMTVIYNGREVSDKLDEALNAANAMIKLVKTDGIYTLAVVEAYENYVVEKINVQGKEIYDRVTPSKKLKIDSNAYEYMMVLDRSGAALGFSNIAVGNVLSVFMSRDKSYLRVIISSAKESGVFNSYKAADNGINITVGEKKYYVPDKSLVLPKTGKLVEMYLDYMGNVAYMKETDREYFASYVYRAIIPEEAFSDKVKVKMLKQDGSVVVAECSDRVVIDGKTRSGGNEILSALKENGSVKPQLMLVECNSDGIIKKLDTAYVNREALEDENTSLTRNLKDEEVTYRWTGSLGSKAVINGSTVIFSVPADSALDRADDKKDFSIISNSDLVSSESYTIDTYNTSSRVGYEEFVVMKGSFSAAYKDNSDIPMLVEEVIGVLTDEGDSVEAVVGFEGGTYKTIMSDGSLSFAQRGVKPGMLIRLLRNQQGEAKDFQVDFDPDLKGTYNTEGNFDKRYGISIGYVNDVVGDVVKLGFTAPDTIDMVLHQFGAPVLIYDEDERENPVRTGTLEEARTYYNDKTDCAHIVIRTYDGTPELFVIYN